MSDSARCMWMRGGTSKGAYFVADDLPAEPAERDRGREAREEHEEDRREHLRVEAVLPVAQPQREPAPEVARQASCCCASESVAWANSWPRRVLYCA